MIRFMRHGHTDWNGPPRRFQGHLDVPLSDRGLSEAREMRGTIAAANAVITSPLQRCRQTLDGVFGPEAETGAAVDPRFMEIDTGDFENRLVSDIAESQADWYQTWQTKPVTVRFPNGEGVVDLARRVTDALNDLTRAPESDIIVFTHGGPIRILMCWLGTHSLNSFHQFKVPNLHLITVSKTELATALADREKQSLIGLQSEGLAT